MERRHIDLPPGARIVVTSDTHMPRMAKALPAELRGGLAGADLVLHGGDFVTADAVSWLETYVPVIGVAGNNDGADIRERFPTSLLLEWQGHTIGMTHGHEGRGATTPARVFNTFRDVHVDAIVFGHSHIPVNQPWDGIVMFNPGSPSDRRQQPQFSYGVLTCSDGLQFEHVFYDSKAP